MLITEEMFNQPYVIGNEPVLEPKNEFLFPGQKLYIDNRNIGRRDIQLLQVGDLVRPWYFFKDLGNGETNCPFDTDRVSLLYNITFDTLNPNNVGDLCYNHAHRFGDGHRYDSPGLINSLLEEGQKKLVDCVKHYSKDAPNKIVFKDGSSTDGPLVFEGHHRKHNLLVLGEKVKVRVYHFYDLPWPLTRSALENAYNSIYDSTFWSPYQDAASKQPWFTLSHFANPPSSHKYQVLMKCLSKIKEKVNIEDMEEGVDIGCGEGVYSCLAAKELGIKIYGVDTEAGQIIRGYFAKMLYKLPDTKFLIGDWDNFAVETGQFGLALSVTHHMKDPFDFMRRFSQNKIAAIIEIRHGGGNKQICGSITKFQTEEEAHRLLASSGMNFELTETVDGDRNFYALYKKV
jgi:hypothetical protein